MKNTERATRITSVKQHTAMSAAGVLLKQNDVVLNAMLSAGPTVVWTIRTMQLRLFALRVQWAETSTISRIFNALVKTGEVENSGEIKCPVTKKIVTARRLSAKQVSPVGL